MKTDELKLDQLDAAQTELTDRDLEGVVGGKDAVVVGGRPGWGGGGWGGGGWGRPGGGWGGGWGGRPGGGWGGRPGGRWW